MGYFLKVQSMVWVNIDIRTKKFTLHQSCVYTEKITETSYKGVGGLKRDGGWLQLKNKEEAERLFAETYSYFEYIEHCL